MKYEDMSDFQIESKIADLLKIKWHSSPKNSPNGQWIYTDYYNEIKGDSVEKQKYSSNTSDIMPIAIEHGFSIKIPDGNLGGVGTITKYIEGARDIKVDYEGKDKTYRAIAICFIKMMNANK